jgi:hypothetical protein
MFSLELGTVSYFKAHVHHIASESKEKHLNQESRIPASESGGKTNMKHRVGERRDKCSGRQEHACSR